MRLREWDEITISGVCTSCRDAVVKDMPAVVATVAPDGFVKVWPLNDADDPDGCGKMWFKQDECEIALTGEAECD